MSSVDPDGRPTAPLLVQPFDSSSLAGTRRLIRQWLAESGLQADRAEAFTFAINEGLINAIMHGGGGGDVTVERAGGRLVATVEDRRPTEPFSLPTRLPPPEALGGRGLWLATGSCDAIRLESGPQGLRLILEVDLPA
jgi:anti-sigma regulatory factor (Ser/Thr protein kinase)